MYTTVWRFYACRTPEWPSIFSCLMSRMYDAKYDDSSKIRRQLDIFMYKNLCIQTCVFNINIKYEHKITNITNKLIFTDIWYPITNIINIKYFLYIFFFSQMILKHALTSLMWYHVFWGQWWLQSVLFLLWPISDCLWVRGDDCLCCCTVWPALEEHCRVLAGGSAAAALSHLDWRRWENIL